MSAQTPSLSEVISEAMESRLEDVQTAMPGYIVSFDNDSCTANVQPAIKRIYTREDGTEFAANLPVIPNVPVIFPGSGSMAPGGFARFGITFPVQKGDEVLLIFSSASLDSWKLSRGKIVAPKNFKPHALTDAVAILGLRSMANAKMTGDANGPSYAGSTYMTLHGDDIRIGGIGADDGCARASDLDFAISSALKSPGIQNALAAHAAATVSGSGVPAAVTALNAAITQHFNLNPAVGSPEVKLNSD